MLIFPKLLHNLLCCDRYIWYKPILEITVVKKVVYNILKFGGEPLPPLIRHRLNGKMVMVAGDIKKGAAMCFVARKRLIVKCVMLICTLYAAFVNMSVHKDVVVVFR